MAHPATKVKAKEMYQMHEVPQSIRAAVSVIAAATLVVFATAVPAPAQQQPEPETVTSAQVSDGELERFTKGLIEVLEIQEEVKQELAAAQDATEAQRLQAEANARMIDALEEQGLDVDRYNVIARSLAEDPELGQRFEQKRQELAEEDS